MNKFKSYITCTFLLVKLSLTAQWLAVPQPTFGCYLGIPVSTKIMLPVNDEKIIYTTYCGSPHGGVTGIYLSDDNLANKEVKYYNGPYTQGTSELTNLVFYNDSTFSYLIIEREANVFYFTQSFFKSRVKLFGYIFPINGVFSSAITPKYLYMIGFGAGLKIFRSAKAVGTAWEQKIIDYYPVRNRLRFINDSVGFTVATYLSNSSKSALFKLTNFGATWLPVLTDSVDNIVDFQISSNNSMFVLKRSGVVLKASNNGASFDSLSAAPAGTYSCIHFANDSIGFIGGQNGVLLKTRDGGRTWKAETSNSEKNIMEVYTYSKNYYFRDADGVVFKFKHVPDPVVAIEEKFDFEVYPNPASELITIKYSSADNSETEVEIVDVLGRKFMNTFFKNRIDFGTSQLPQGVYFVRLIANKKTIKLHKVVILH